MRVPNIFSRRLPVNRGPLTLEGTPQAETTDEIHCSPPYQGASIFDSIKLELAAIILAALGATLVIARLDAPQWVELLIMAALGMGSGAWIVLRTHWVMRSLRTRLPVPMHRARGQSSDP